jgi:hypothetical protein
MESDESPESPVQRLPYGPTQRSFEVLAQWLKDNREALQQQIAGLAIRFEEVDRENKRRLDDIHQETRRTNGRVTEVEKTVELKSALDAGHMTWEQQAEESRRIGLEAKSRRREKLTDRLTSICLVVLGALAAKYLPQLGLG